MRLSDVLLQPEKTYTPKGNGVQGKILAVGVVTTKGEWHSQPVTLQGIDNTKANITHSSKHPDSMLNQSHIGKDSTWRLKWWMNNNQQRQEITGYPESKIPGEASMTNLPNPAVPYNDPNAGFAGPPPPQSVPYPNPTARTIVQDKPDWDAIAEGKVRHGVVCAFISAGKFDVEVNVVDYWVRYIIDGSVVAEEPQAQELYEQGVCPSCQLLRVDCTCPTEPFIR